MSSGKRHSIVIVDDHAMFRAGVRAELGDAVEVIAEAADVDEAVAAVLDQDPVGHHGVAGVGRHGDAVRRLVVGPVVAREPRG